MTMLIEKRLNSFDGTELGYRIQGGARPPEPRPAGSAATTDSAPVAPPWLILINGLGSTYDTWDELIRALGESYRILSWDLRGLYSSAVPQDRRRLTLEDHCRDLEQLMAAEGITSAVVGGWSMGVQLALEAYRRFPSRIKGLVLINGTFGRFFSSCFPLLRLPLLLPVSLRMARLAAPLIEYVVRLQVDTPGFSQRLRQSGITRVETPRIDQAARHFGELNWDLYLEMAGHMERHDAAAVLPRIRVPTLVLGGSRDFLAPTSVIRRMAREIPGAEVHQVEDGSHYTILEYPEIVIPRILSFLARFEVAPIC